MKNTQYKLKKNDRKWLRYLTYKQVIQSNLESLIHKQKNEARQTRKKRYARKKFTNQDSIQQNQSSTEHKDGASREKGRKQ